MLNGVQTLLTIPCGKINFSAMAGESFYGLQAEARTCISVSPLESPGDSLTHFPPVTTATLPLRSVTSVAGSNL